MAQHFEVTRTTNAVKVVKLDFGQGLTLNDNEAHELASKLADLLGYDLEKRTNEDKYTE